MKQNKLAHLIVIGLLSLPRSAFGQQKQDQVRSTIASHMPTISVCYKDALAHHPDLVGKVLVKFVVNGHGRVSQASIVKRQTTAKSPELYSCLLGALRDWKFPAPPKGESAVVTYPFIFSRIPHK